MAKQIEVPIPHKTALGLIEDGLKDGVNKHVIAEFVMETMDKESVAMMIMLLQLKTPYEKIQPGDYVRFHNKTAWFTDNIDIDVMIDMGLCVDNYYFGRVPSRDQYGNDINAFSSRLDVEFMCYDQDKKMITKKERIDRHAVEVISIDTIPFFSFDLADKEHEEAI